MEILSGFQKEPEIERPSRIRTEERSASEGFLRGENALALSKRRGGEKKEGESLQIPVKGEN